MDIASLCKKIELQPELSEKVLAFADHFDFQSVAVQLQGFLTYETMQQSLTELMELLGEDEDHSKILACMLKASADAWEIYRARGILDDIYDATMRCYTRFIDETYRMTGRAEFDRYWWTTRQAGCHLFRIGELEYEIRPAGQKKVIDMHIPSDADFSPSAVDRSLERAGRFFREYDPKLGEAQYCCESWLLDRQLEGMLGEDSNIVRFQKRFDICDAGEPGTEFVGWIFKSRSDDPADWPEDTTLQRNVKKHILAGGVIRSACGKLRRNF